MQHRNSIRTICGTLVITLVLGWAWLASGGTALAQAEPVNATPGVNKSVQEVPGTVSLDANENMNPDPAGTNMFVYGPHGQLISQGDAVVDPNQPRKMVVHIKDDGEGIYVVQWKTVSAADGKAAQGAYTFTVAQNQNNFPLLAMTVSTIIALGLGILMGIGLGQRRAAIAALATEAEAEEPVGSKQE